MSYNVLIVDDSAVTREVLSRTLRLCGIDLGQIYQAGNGVEALKMLEEHWADLVFTDINMPVMDGLHLLEELRKREEWADLPVVVVSTEGSKSRIDELKSRGIRGYVRKPFTPEQIAAVIESIMGSTEHA
jgi:two-component system chemotaxis response regulator CheY